MKNKTKKVLAGVALGVISVATLTGCDMSAVDMEKWEKKADAVVETLTDVNTKLTEQNEELIDANNKYAEIVNQMNNDVSNITKKEALDKLLIARSRFLFQEYNQIKMDVDSKRYEGVFDRLKTGEYDWYQDSYTYKYDNNTKVFYEKSTTSNEIEEGLLKGDFSNNIYYEYFFDDGAWELGLSHFDGTDSFLKEYSKVFDWFRICDLSVTKFTEDNVYDIQVIEGGYKITLCFTEISKYDSSENNPIDITMSQTLLDITIIDERITNIECKQITGKRSVYSPDLTEPFIKDNEGNYLYSNMEIFHYEFGRLDNLESKTISVNYEYENINYDDIDSIIADVEEEYKDYL